MKKTSNTYKLAVCAIMVALGAVLSPVKVVQMPLAVRSRCFPCCRARWSPLCSA